MLPPLLRALIRAAAPPDQRDWLIADLEEEAAVRAGSGGAHAARRWVARQAVVSIAPLLRRRAAVAVATIRRTCMNTLRGLKGDLVLALRRLLEAPVFALTCIATLALGLGGNAAVFTLIDRVLLKPLPVHAPDELFRLGDGDDCCVNSGLAGSFSLFSYDLYLQLKGAAPEFVELAAFQANTRAVTLGRPDDDAPGETLNGVFVSGNYFRMLGLRPAAGRLVQPPDDRAGAPAVAVISHAAWVRRFSQRPDVAGAAVLLNGVPATIVGVAPEGYYGETLRPNPPEIWIPLSNEPQLQPASRLLEARPSHWLYVIGRLPPGTPLAPLASRLTATLQHWLSTAITLRPELRAEILQQSIAIVPAPSGVSSMRDAVAPALRLLQIIAAVVLLVACANLANLLLARGLARRTETAVRVALGAPRARLVAQTMVESVVLACAGGVVGLLVAYAGASAILDIAFRDAAVPVDPSPSARVLAFAFLASLLTALVFGAAPAVIGARSDPIDAMRGAGRATADRGSTLRRSLIALQVALSLVLVTSAGLLARSLRNLEAQDFGFRTEGRYAVALAPSLTTVPPEELQTLYPRLRERLRQVRGVANAAFSLYGPMSGDNWSTQIVVDGGTSREPQVASYNRITPGYFETTGTPILRGRGFDDRDGPDRPPVAVVSQTFVRRFFGDVDPIGRRLGFAGARGPGAPEIEIVGIAGDAKYQDGKAAAYPMFFMPFLQRTTAGRIDGGAPVRLDRSHYPQALIVQTSSPVAALESEVRRALAAVDRRVIVRSMLPLDEQVLGHFTLDRLTSRLSIAFGGVALLLACLGLYGVTAQSVARRTREIGIRMAIGATRARVLQTVLRGAASQLAIGVALGVPAALAAGQLLRSRLYHVEGWDPLVLAAAVGLMAIGALAAAAIPARRAANLDPVRALRVE